MSGLVLRFCVKMGMRCVNGADIYIDSVTLREREVEIGVGGRLKLKSVCDWSIGVLGFML